MQVSDEDQTMTLLQLNPYTAQDWVLIIVSVGGVLTALIKLFIDNNANKRGLDEAHAKIAEQAKTMASLEASIADLKVKPAQLEATIAKLEATIVSLQRKLDETEADLKDCIAQLESRIPPLYNRRKPASPEEGNRR